MGEAARQLTGPGIYARGTVDYNAIDAVNYSTLKEMARSPKHYAHRLKHARSQTTSMFRGSAAHTAIIEPEEFMRRYVMFDGKRKAGKAWESFEADATAAGKEVLKESEFLEAMAMRDAVRADPIASRYLIDGQREATLVWLDPETRTLCKGRPDYVTRVGDADVVVDLKTSKDPSPFWFARDVAKYQYHVQAAMYGDGFEVITQRPAMSVIIAVENSPPYDVVTYALPEAVLGPGRDAYRQWLRTLQECRQEKRWPGYANGFEMTLTLPAWALPDEGDLEALGLEQ